MSESVDVFKEKILEELDRLEANKPPPRNGGGIYLTHLRNKIATDNVISVSEMIENLALAGYSIEDIIKFLIDIGIVNSNDDVVKFRDGVRRVMMKMKKEREM